MRQISMYGSWGSAHARTIATLIARFGFVTTIPQPGFLGVAARGLYLTEAGKKWLAEDLAGAEAKSAARAVADAEADPLMAIINTAA